MSDVCVVTAYSRPEMLHECLNRIVVAQGNRDLRVNVAVDARLKEGPHNAEVIEVARSFQSKLELSITQRIPHAYPGNSYNTLEALREAFQANPHYVFLVEDDVMVGKDFFQWHYAAQALAHFFCSIAVRCTRRNDVNSSLNPSKIWVSGSDYASLGVCLPQASLAKILMHARPQYYENMNAYMHHYFSTSRFGNEFCEQDGLILRVMGYWGGLSAWPYVPRAFHAGYYGYHRMDGSKPMGTLEERIKNFREIMFDPNIMATLGPNIGDIMPCSLDGYHWQTLDIDETFG